MLVLSPGTWAVNSSERSVSTNMSSLLYSPCDRLRKAGSLILPELNERLLSRVK
jgi:hypothetical protein